MTFAPVVPPVILIVIAAAVIVLRLITMRQLATNAGQRWTTVWRWSGLTLAVLLIVIAAARPGIEREDPQATATARSGQNTNVFFVVDRSADSGVSDYGDGQSRMSGIRADVDALVDRYPQARFALITFAARPSLAWPLSEDAWSLKPVIARLTPYAAAGEEGEQMNAAAAANVLRYKLIAAGQQYPDSQNLVYYFGSGAPGSRAQQGEFDPVPGSVDGGAVLGYGTALNEPGLRDIAEQLGVTYSHREDDTPIATPDGDLAQHDGSTVVSSRIAERTELYWVFTLVAAVLLLFEVFMSIREFRRMRMAHRDVSL